MLEPMTIWGELWIVTADDMGLWKIGGIAPLRDGPVYADNSIHFLIESLLSKNGFDPRPPAQGGDCLMIHSTSWRPYGPRMLHTYLAAVRPRGLAMDTWPDAIPITPDLWAADAAGKPPTHGATEEPIPRTLDVLIHGIGHFKWQINHNATHRRALGTLWRMGVRPFKETLAEMYEEIHEPAA